ncbi:hypothetical protein ECRN5871_1998 [Escherichia coli RN587/1]|nr:hypothetical protein ECRN5871_1998 [Escherichia coli RN587/1]EKI22556.1 hypothetical protein ECARS42123_4495 [Escherichia coli ARS4.2123]
MKKYSQIRPSGLTIVLWRKCPEADKKKPNKVEVSDYWHSVPDAA